MVYSSYSFKKGDIVKVTNDAVFHGEICEFDKIKPKGEHLVRLPEDGRLVCIKPQNLTLVWSKEEFMDLRRAQLTQLQVLAVDMGDKPWFDQLSNELEQIESVRKGVET